MNLDIRKKEKSKKKKKTKPEISKVAFWNINFKMLDYEKESTFIITKIFMHGTYNDLISILKYYSFKRIKNEIKKASYLDKKTLAFCCNYFNLKKEEFKCFIERQSIPKLWDY